MRFFKTVKEVQPAPVPADGGTQVLDLMQMHGLTYGEALRTVRATESWEVVSACMTGLSVAEMCGRLDAYDAAVAHESWRERVLADAGETTAGMVIAGAVTLIACGVMAWLGQYLAAVT